MKTAKRRFKRSKQANPAPNQYFKDIFVKGKAEKSSRFEKAPRRITDPSKHHSFFVMDKRKSRLYKVLKEQK